MDASSLLEKPGSHLSQRLISLDAFRGITIAGMILVNNPGTWGKIYPPLRHAEWHGWTPTDLVFPFFLFIVGVAMTFSLNKRLAQGANRWGLLTQITRRSLTLILLGLASYAFPDVRLMWPFVVAIVGLGLVPARFEAGSRAGPWLFVALATLLVAVVGFAADFGYFHQRGLRVPGVLQRIGVCYFVAGLIMLTGGVVWRSAWTAVLLVGYWAVLTLVESPGGYTNTVTGPEGMLGDWIDEQVLAGHLYRERPDPEGLLSTLPAIASTLIGVLTGAWLRSGRDALAKVVGLFVAANALVVAGWLWGLEFPVNKKIWTSSYVLLTGGLALHFLAMCYWLIDWKGWRAWAWPFVVYGSNAITVFLASGLLAKLLGRWQIETADGVMSVRRHLFEAYFVSWAAPPLELASLLYAVTYVALWLLPMIVLYKLRIFIKV